MLLEKHDTRACVIEALMQEKALMETVVYFEGKKAETRNCTYVIYYSSRKYLGLQGKTSDI